MYRSATLAMVVSSTSMNVGTTTATATNQGLIAGRLTRGGASVMPLMMRALFSRLRFGLVPAGRSPSRNHTSPKRKRGAPLASPLGFRGALRKRLMRLQDVAGVRPRGGFLVVHVGDDRQADEQGDLVRVVIGQFDSYGKSLHDLDVVARGVLRRQQGEGFTRPHGETGDAALE